MTDKKLIHIVKHRLHETLDYTIHSYNFNPKHLWFPTNHDSPIKVWLQ
jgi:hypothetical protein